jgi:hypothetical protein
MSEPDHRSGVSILVSAKKRAVQSHVNVTLLGDMLAQIDTFAEAHGYTRSGVLNPDSKKKTHGAGRR